MYTEANAQHNTDFGVHFLIVFIFMQNIFIDNTFQQLFKFYCADKENCFVTHGRTRVF